jgi:hypothetical protein
MIQSFGPWYRHGPDQYLTGMRTLFVGEERRRRRAQREAVAAELSRATGRTAVVRFDDGSIYVYDEVRTGDRPGTHRVHISESGQVLERTFLRFTDALSTD